MARSSDQKRRPRVRKSAPTVRERVQAASSSQETKQQRFKKVASPIKKLNLGKRRAFRIMALPFRYIGRFLRWIIPSYFINAGRELRLVYWPNRRETWRLTAAVFVFAIVFGALVAGVDKGLDEIFKKVVLK